MACYIDETVENLLRINIEETVENMLWINLQRKQHMEENQSAIYANNFYDPTSQSR